MLLFVRSLQLSVWIAACLVAAATVAAIMDDRVTSLLIGAAMVASCAAVFGYQMDRRLGDAYDSGRRSERRADVRGDEDLVD